MPAGLRGRDQGQDQYDLWSPCGRKLIGKVPQGHGRTPTLLAALRRDRLIAPCVLDGPIEGVSFFEYVEQILTPPLKLDDIVVIDNLGSHKAKRNRTALRAGGAKLSSCRSTAPIFIP